MALLFLLTISRRYLEPIWVGMAVMTLGFGLFVDLSVNFSLPKIIIFQLIAGLGVGLVFQSPLITLQSLVAPENLATATATFGFVRNIGCSISIVLGGGPLPERHGSSFRRHRSCSWS
jgi:predicted MFS family arabinose efflux permease